MASPLVTPQWLKQQLESADKPVVLDASIEFQIPLEREKDKSGVIPGAQRFDYDTVFCDPDSPLSHMMPSESRFNELAAQLGITPHRKVVVYDNSGTYASPRAWWMLKALGLDEVYILSGGLPEWKAAGYSTEDTFCTQECSQLSQPLNPSHFISAETVLSHSNNDSACIVDARSLARYKGEAKEPREGLRSGHIPKAVCLPFAELIEDGKLKPVETLLPLFADITEDKQQPLVFSCGSGITACILALGAHICGYENISVYDGSWSEWGQRHDLPIEV